MISMDQLMCLWIRAGGKGGVLGGISWTRSVATSPGNRVGVV